MSLIDHFLTGDYKVKRSKRGTYIKGRYVAGPEEELEVSGSLQPTNARQLKLSEEGNRLRQYWKFYSDQPILVNSMATLSKGDRVIVNGEEYRAMALTTWAGTSLDYFMTILWREPEQKSDGKGSGP
jgi:hypothetical protein